MRPQIFFVSVIVLCVSATLGQNTKPSPKTDEVVKISTNLIQLDVTVTDKKGNPITNIRPEEIEIFENGKKQKITSLSFVSGVREAIDPPKSKEEKPKIAIPIPTTTIKPENVRRTVALIVDDLTLSWESAHFTRVALRKFVDQQVLPGDLVAIIRTGAGMGSLQQFTTDKNLLYAAIERVKWNPMGTGGIGAFAPIEPTPLQQAKAAGANISERQLESERIRNNAAEDFRGSIFVSGTLGAVRFVINGMSQLPGRKSIIMFSDGFRMFTRDESGNEDGRVIFELLRKLVDHANRASVVINTVDSRGLVYTGYTAADNVTDTSVDAMMRSLNDRSDQLFETQQGLAFLAEETGGLAIRNNNDLAGGVRRILEDQSYYLIAYEPDEATFNPAAAKFNKIDIRVSRFDAVVRYRSGFFNNVTSDNAAGMKPTPFRQLMDALSSPFANTGIQVRLNPLFGNDPKEGSYVRSYLHIDAKDLKFVDAPEGKKKATVTIVAAAFGETGAAVNQVSQGYSITLKPEDMKDFLNEGFIYSFVFPMKKPGGFQYRVAIRDNEAGTLGSVSQFVQIPKIKKGSAVLSGIVLDNFTPAQWQVAASERISTNAANDTSIRRFSRGTVLQYSADIYGLDLKSLKDGQLSRKFRIFHEGKLVIDGREHPISTANGNAAFSGAITLGQNLTPGEYILQVVVIDSSKKESKRYATQVVQFEVVS